MPICAEPAMANQHDKPANTRHDPTAGNTAGANTQSQGGISHQVAQAAAGSVDPTAGLPNGPLGAHVALVRQSLDEGGGKDPPDGRAHHGLSGDDGEHEPADHTGTPASLQPGRAADLGAQQDQRLHGMPRDPAARTTGADTPNQGGVAGAPGHPSPESPMHFPGDDPSDGVTGGGGPSHLDEQRDPQI
jgi:hypothetical protein